MPTLTIRDPTATGRPVGAITLDVPNRVTPAVHPLRRAMERDAAITCDSIVAQIRG